MIFCANLRVWVLCCVSMAVFVWVCFSCYLCLITILLNQVPSAAHRHSAAVIRRGDNSRSGSEFLSLFRSGKRRVEKNETRRAEIVRARGTSALGR